MGSMVLYPFVRAAGALQLIGNSMNAQLNRSRLSPWLASVVSFSLIVAMSVPMLGGVTLISVF